MQRDAFEQAGDFIWRNARQLEKYRFAYHFLGGPRSAVITCLHTYQNADGGFGKALEPDKRYPGSTPIDVTTAFQVLDEIEGFKSEMVLQACNFLQTITTEEGGVPFSLSQVNEYPHAPWWGTDETDPPASVNPTAEICALLMKHGIEHSWLQPAIAYCWSNIPALPASFHNFMPAVHFFQYASDPIRSAELLAKIKSEILQGGLVAFERYPNGYIQYPLDWAPYPQHPLNSLFTEEQIQNDLDALQATQQADGGWAINWETISPSVAQEWRGIVTLRNLLTLKAYQQLV